MTAVPRHVSDMTVMEERWSRAWHELQCDEDPAGHPLEEHEPFDVEESDFTWQEFVEVLRRHRIQIEVL